VIAVPFFFQSDIHYQQRLLDLVRELHVPFLFGAVGWQPKTMTDVQEFVSSFINKGSDLHVQRGVAASIVLNQLRN